MQNSRSLCILGRINSHCSISDIPSRSHPSDFLCRRSFVYSPFIQCHRLRLLRSEGRMNG